MRALALILLAGCATGCKIPVDPSIAAVEAKDLTLIGSACETLPGRGADICRVKEGQAVTGGWRLVIPRVKGSVVGSEVTVYFKGRSLTVSGGETNVVEIPWEKLTKGNTWSRDDDGQALALATVRWKDDRGVIDSTRARGIAIIVVTRPGYDPLSLDSDHAAFGTKCTVVYTTAGRGALSCK
jgi:hypothetical protein